VTHRDRETQRQKHTETGQTETGTYKAEHSDTGIYRGPPGQGQLERQGRTETGTHRDKDTQRQRLTDTGIYRDTQKLGYTRQGPTDTGTQRDRDTQRQEHT
jgi:hypothetical protein